MTAGSTARTTESRDRRVPGNGRTRPPPRPHFVRPPAGRQPLAAPSRARPGAAARAAPGASSPGRGSGDRHPPPQRRVPAHPAGAERKAAGAGGAPSSAPLPAQCPQRRQPAAITGQRLTRSGGGRDSGGAGQGGSEGPSLARSGPPPTFPTWRLPAVARASPRRRPCWVRRGLHPPPCPTASAGRSRAAQPALPCRSRGRAEVRSGGRRRAAGAPRAAGRAEGGAGPAQLSWCPGSPRRPRARRPPAAPGLGARAAGPPVSPRAGEVLALGSLCTPDHYSKLNVVFQYFHQSCVWFVFLLSPRWCRLDLLVQSTCKWCKNKKGLQQSARF